MEETLFLGAFKKPFFTGTLVRRIQKIPDCMLYEPIEDDLNRYIVEYDFDVCGIRFTVEREYSECRLYVKTPNAPASIISAVRAALIGKKRS